MVRIPGFYCYGPGAIPGQGAEITQTTKGGGLFTMSHITYPGMGEPVGLPSLGSHRVEHD